MAGTLYYADGELGIVSQTKPAAIYRNGVVYQASYGVGTVLEGRVIGSYANGLVYKAESSLGTVTDGQIVASYGRGEIQVAHPGPPAIVGRVIGTYGCDIIHEASPGVGSTLPGRVIGSYDGDDEGAAAAAALTILSKPQEETMRVPSSDPDRENHSDADANIAFSGLKYILITVAVLIGIVSFLQYAYHGSLLLAIIHCLTLALVMVSYLFRRGVAFLHARTAMRTIWILYIVSIIVMATQRMALWAFMIVNVVVSVIVLSLKLWLTKRFQK